MKKEQGEKFEKFDLNAESLDVESIEERNNLDEPNCAGTCGTYGCAGGCFGTVGTYGCCG
jgi:hypothetical protein